MADKRIDKIDTEELIHEIEKYPAIWNPLLDEYSDRIAKKTAWVNVLNHFIKDFEGKTPPERRELCTLLQKKWKNLRDCYAREVSKKRQENKSGSAGKSRKTYVFYDHLKFLDVSARKTDGTFDNESGSKTGEDSDKEEPVGTAPNKQQRGRKRKSKTENEDLLQPQNTPCTERQNQDAYDNDKLFMLSMLQELKKVPEHLRLDLKTRIMEVIYHAQQAACAGNQRNSFEHRYHAENQHQFRPSYVPYGYGPPPSGQTDFRIPDMRSQRPDNCVRGQIGPVHISVTVSPMYPEQPSTYVTEPEQQLQPQPPQPPSQPMRQCKPSTSFDEEDAISPSEFDS